MTAKRQQQHDEDSTEEHSSLTSKSSSGSLLPEHETGPATDDEETEQEDTPLAQLFDLLSESELEMAARANYEYWKEQEPQKTSSSSSMSPDEHHRRRLLAQPLLQRFLSSQKYNVAKAAQRLKETLQFRQRRKVDRMCTVFEDHSQGTTNGNDTRTSAQQPAKSIDDDDDAADDDDDLWRSQLQRDLSAGHVFVQGYDRQGRSTFHFIPRLVPHHTSPEATLLPHIYTLERAVACSQYRRSCPEQHTSTTTTGTVNAVVDFSGFSIRQHAPPISGARIFLQTLRQHYAGVLHKIYILHAPASFGRLWKLLQHFVAPETRDKIQFVNDIDHNTESDNKNNKNHQGDNIPDLYDVSQATPWMMRGGQKTRALDIEEYLFQTPFDKAFDEEEQESMNK